MQKQKIPFDKRKELFFEQIVGYHSGSYNTLFSVVQGVSIAVLCTVVQDHLKSAKTFELSSGAKHW
jgi:hypothetical protein